MNHAIISLGCNHGDRQASIEKALSLLSPWIVESTPPYENPDRYGRQVPCYLNVVTRVEFEMSLEEFSEQCKTIEQECGRTPRDKSTGLVAMDIDVVIYNDRVVSEPDYATDYFTQGYRFLSKNRP